jgi:DNA-binding LytR/AlgR family response regulator
VQNTRHVVLLSLKNFESQLPDDMFKRVHKQYIVNLLHIATVTTGDIILTNKQSIPVSNAYRQQLLDQVVNKKVLHR